VNHVAQERSDSYAVKQAHRCETAIANRDKYTVTISGASTVSAKSYTEKESVSSVCKRTVLFWVITQRVVVISYRRFGTTYRSHVKGPRILKDFLILDP